MIRTKRIITAKITEDLNYKLKEGAAACRLKKRDFEGIVIKMIDEKIGKDEKKKGFDFRI